MSWRTLWSAFALAGMSVACGGVEGPELAGETADDSDELANTEDAATACTVRIGNELMIRALSVVNDPVRTTWTGAFTNASDGAWHFGRLMSQMAGTQNASDFTLAWLRQWAAARTINGQVVPARTQINTIINAWPKLANGKLDMRRPPMRLLAIVNRIDLPSFTQGKVGEGRFVFGVLDGAGNPLQFTVILEYQLPGNTAAQRVEWSDRWHALSSLTVGTAAYNTALQAVTDLFARRNAVPARPNGSAISQVRTNEIALAGPWELREFGLTTAGALVERTVDRTPDDAFNNNARLARFINANQAAILAQTHTVPLSFESAPFRAAAIFNNIDFWAAPGITNNNARHLFSLNTCNGCHGDETDTGFLQVNPRAQTQVASLAGFLTGITVSDPVVPSVSRTFNDLNRRGRVVGALSCPLVITGAEARAAAAETETTRVH